MKLPSSLPRAEHLRAVPPAIRYTFMCCYTLALAEDPVGYVTVGAGHPVSVTYLAGYVGSPRTTLLDHLARLFSAALLGRDQEGIMFVPSILQGSARDTPVPSTPGFPRHPVDNGVDNQLVLDFASAPGVGPPSESDGPPTPPSPYVVLEEKRRTPVDEREPTDGPRFDLVPAQLADTTAGYLVAKLAAGDEAWARAIAHPRDQRALAHLWRENPAVLTDALQQQALAPTARRPLAWLTARCREPAEVAS